MAETVDYSGENETFAFVWTIENFNLCHQKVGEFIQSPYFLVNILNNAKFYLKIYPRGKTAENTNVCSEFRRAENDDGLDFVIFKLVLSIYGNNILIENVSYTKRAKRNTVLLKEFSVKLNSINESTENVLMDHTLTVRCDISKSLVEKQSVLSEYYVKSIVNVQHYEYSLPIVSNILKDFSTSDIPNQEYCIKTSFYYHSDEIEEFQACFHFKSYLELDKSGEIKISRITFNTKIPLLIKCKAYLLDCNHDSKSLECDELWVESDEEKWRIPFRITTSNVKFGNRTSIAVFHCEFIISDGTMTSHIRTVNHPSKHKSINSDSFGSTVLKSMYTDKKFCDVILKVESDRIEVHKSVLCAKSSVFTAMFSSEMKEKELNQVEISDISSETLHEMLSFIYTGTVGDLQDDSAFQLYSAADKYDIKELKELCSFIIAEKLSVANICEVLHLADLHHDLNLKKIAHRFISLHGKEIFQSDKWKDFMEKQIELAANVMHNICLKWSEIM